MVAGGAWAPSCDEKGPPLVFSTMIIALRPGTEKKLVDQVIAEVTKLGYQPHPIIGEIQTVIAAIGDKIGRAHV